ncbi:hypothetical protein [Streptomyces sp. TRM70350]|uniref:hypothetical protein n=1 Tax=Streptomyces sp. TRM70350 TaxID=2856165 RepID=UPI001C481CF8|nr:hypothetical protein [Streptomyces sp. TRM70350]MBV7699482.1 hypothetical protein [Streptomyces sp. TRM70350]
MLTPGHIRRAVEVVTVRRDRSAPSGETTVVRLLGLLPADWSCTFDVSPDRVRLWVEPGRGGDRNTVRRAMAEVLADTALYGWSQEN